MQKNTKKKTYRKSYTRIITISVAWKRAEEQRKMRERRKNNDDVMPKSKDIARRQSERSPRKKRITFEERSKGFERGLEDAA